LGTLLELDGKCKDSEKARLHMRHLGMRKDQHPIVENGMYTLLAVLYYLGKYEKTLLCNCLAHAFDIKRCVDVKGCKVTGLKTHDYHVML
jgi:hypothetical protein